MGQETIISATRPTSNVANSVSVYIPENSRLAGIVVKYPRLLRTCSGGVEMNLMRVCSFQMNDDRSVLGDRPCCRWTRVCHASPAAVRAMEVMISAHSRHYKLYDDYPLKIRFLLRPRLSLHNSMNICFTDQHECSISPRPKHVWDLTPRDDINGVFLSSARR